MTSFASAFSSSSHDENFNHQEESTNFSNIDLDQQPNSPQHSSYVSLTDAATLHSDSSVVTPNTNPRVPTSSSQELPSNSLSKSTFDTSSILSEKRISIPDMSKISASSAAAVAAVGPTIDKLRQWGRSTYKCTKQSIYEKLGKTTRTIDVELDNQIEVWEKNRIQFLYVFLHYFSN